MTIVKLNKRKYTAAVNGRGIYGKYTRVAHSSGDTYGYGIVDTLGKSASKMVLGGVGKSTGSFYGKKLGKIIGEKTGSKLLGNIAKASIGSLGGLAGEKIGSQAGKYLGNTVFSDDEKKKKAKKTAAKSEGTTSLSQLLDNARSRIESLGGTNPPTSGSGMQMVRAGRAVGRGIMLNY